MLHKLKKKLTVISSNRRTDIERQLAKELATH